MRRIAAYVAAGLYRAINGTLNLAARLLWPRSRPATAERVCVFRIGNIGDVVCALPAIRTVRQAYPNAHLTLLTSPGPRGTDGAADVLESSEWIDELRIYYAEDIDTWSKRFSLLRELHARRFDVWIDLPNNLTSIARQFRDMGFARLAGAKWARGWQIDTLRWAAQAQSEHLLFRNEVDRTLRVVRRAGFEAVEVRFDLPRMPDVETRVAGMLRSRGFPASRLIAIAPEAKRLTNSWLVERFAEVGRQLSNYGFTILLLGGKCEEETCRTLAGQIGRGAHSFAGEMSISESCELLRHCRLAICLDSGVQHLAAAVGTPCVSLFSFWQMRGKWHPYGSRNVVIQKWVPCHTCMLDECPHGNRCMKAIQVEEVVANAVRVLGAEVVSPVPSRNTPDTTPRSGELRPEQKSLA
jgi:ADP-heptose:LPS heptosyltransferase